MPTVNLNREVVEKLIGKKLTLEQLKDRISMIGTDLERVEGNEIVVEVFPNRPDMLSEPGFARALSSFVGARTGLRKYDVKKPAKDYKVIVDKSVAEVRPFTSCAIVKGLKFNDEKLREIIQLQEKLHVTFGRNRKKLAIGIYPLEKIVMPITYKAMKPGDVKFRPLESDIQMTGKEILEKHPKGKEFAHLLEGAKAYPVFVDAKNNVLSMPPVINSHETGKVTEKTTDLFIECSGFDQRVLDECINIIVTSLAELGGEIHGMELDYGRKKTASPNLEPREMKLDLAYANKMIGLELKEAEAKKLLEKMGFGYSQGKVLIPAYRADILHPIDIAEDMAIAYGYENFEPEIPNVMTIGEEHPVELFKARVASIMSGMGMLECMSYHLISKEAMEAKTGMKVPLVELENSKSDRNALRPALGPNLMQVLSENTNKEYPQEIFELGVAFRLGQNPETGVDEEEHLAIAMAGADIDFTRAKQVLEELFKSLGLECSVEKANIPSFIPGRRAAVLSGKAGVGVMGEVHPQVLENYGIQMPVSVIELDIGKIYELVGKKA